MIMKYDKILMWGHTQIWKWVASKSARFPVVIWVCSRTLPSNYTRKSCLGELFSQNPLGVWIIIHRERVSNLETDLKSILAIDSVTISRRNLAKYFKIRLTKTFFNSQMHFSFLLFFYLRHLLSKTLEIFKSK